MPETDGQRTLIHEGEGVVEAVILEDGRWVDVTALKQATTGADWPPSSKQIKDLALVGWGDGAIEPPFSLSLLYDWVYVSAIHGACVGQKVIDIFEIGWHLDRGEQILDAETPDPAQRERLMKVLLDPNDQEDTFIELMSKVGRDFEAVGNGFLEVVRGPETAEKPLALFHMPAPTVRVRRKKNDATGDYDVSYVQIRGLRRRYFKPYGEARMMNNVTGDYVPEGGSLAIQQQASEVIHFRLYTHLSEFYGAPEWLASLNAMLANWKAQEYNIEFFDNKAVPAYAVVAEGGRLTDESKEMLRQFFSHELKGKHHRTVILDAVPGQQGATVTVKFEQLAVEVRDASFRLFRQDNAQEILSAHKVPPYRIGWALMGSLGGATAAEMTQIYVDSVIEPRQTRFEARLNKLFADAPLNITDWALRFNNLDTRDRNIEAGLHERYQAMGALSINDILTELGKESVDGGDEKIVWLSGQPIRVSDLPIILDKARDDALRGETGNGQRQPDLMTLLGISEKRLVTRRFRERLIKRFTEKVQGLMLQKARGFIDTLSEDRLRALAELVQRTTAQVGSAGIVEKAAAPRPLSLSERQALEGLFRDIDSFYNFDDIGDETLKFMRAIATWAGQQANAEMGFALAFDLRNPAILAAFKRLAGEHIRDITTTAKDDLRDLLMEKFFEEGKNPLDIARSIRKNLGDQIAETYRHRAETIARTETGVAQEVTQDEVFRRAGVQTYTWITAGDDKVRPSHQALHGVTVKVGERFPNGLRFPLDPQGSADEIINCRCDVLPGFTDIPIPEDQLWTGE